MMTMIGGGGPEVAVMTGGDREAVRTIAATGDLIALRIHGADQVESADGAAVTPSMIGIDVAIVLTLDQDPDHGPGPGQDPGPNQYQGQNLHPERILKHGHSRGRSPIQGLGLDLNPGH